MSLLTITDEMVMGKIYLIREKKVMPDQDVLRKLEQPERKVLLIDDQAAKHEEEIQNIFPALKQLLNQPPA